jgi:N-acetylglucosamine repressor
MRAWRAERSTGLTRPEQEEGFPLVKATTSALKRANMKNVLEFIHARKKTSKQEIALQLGLSRPTVSQIVRELMEGELIAQKGSFRSTGGRKADALVFVPRARIAVGVELLKQSFEIVAIDLYGEIIHSEMQHLPFSNAPEYVDCVCRAVNLFIEGLPVEKARVLGVNIVLQGLISSDGKLVTYGKILDCTGMSIDQFKPYIDYPCGMVHDGEAAATVELWFSRDIVNAIFIHIRYNMSGALIIGGKFLKGNELKSGVFEHMTIVPDGRPCYCGKHGCVDTYCTMQALLKPGEPPEQFFALLRAGGSAESARWDEYLSYLAVAIDNLHMMMDYDVILGGILGRFLQQQDIDRLHRLVAARTAFPTERRFIRIGATASIPIAVGAALPYIIHYLDF